MEGKVFFRKKIEKGRGGDKACANLTVINCNSRENDKNAEKGKKFRKHSVQSEEGGGEGEK